MTYKQKIYELQRYSKIHRKVDRLMDEISEWRSIAESITSSCSGICVKGFGENKIEKSVEEIDAIRMEMSDAVILLCEERRRLENAMKTVKNLEEREIIYLKYIRGKTFESIAEMLHYSVRWIMELHKRAIQKIRIK